MQGAVVAGFSWTCTTPKLWCPHTENELDC